MEPAAELLQPLQHLQGEQERLSAELMPLLERIGPAFHCHPGGTSLMAIPDLIVDRITTLG